MLSCDWSSDVCSSDLRIQGAEPTVLYTPTFRTSLLSIGQFDTAGYTSTFGGGVCETSSGYHTVSGRKRGNLYMVEAEGNASAHTDELSVESELQQAEPPAASPDKGPKARGEGKKESKTRKRQRQHDQDRRQSPNRSNGIERCVCGPSTSRSSFEQ